MKPVRHGNRFRAAFGASILLVVGLLAAIIGAAGPASAVPPPPPSYYPSGPQTFVNESVPLSGGWVVCWSGTYQDTPSIASVLNACNGAYLMLASGPVGNPVLDVLAAAPRADVLFETGQYDYTTTHAANGSNWYYDSNWSWGFAGGGDAVYKSSCDGYDVFGPGEGGPIETDRLCWHTYGGSLSPGWRSGATLWLNNPQEGSTSFRREILQPAPGPVCTITGSNYPDRLTGTPGNDVICGRGGNDTITAVSGNDIIYGGDGVDLIIGGPGNDTIYGDAGNDVIFGGLGTDKADGGQGFDTCTQVESAINCEKVA